MYCLPRASWWPFVCSAAPAREDGGTVVERELDVERFAGIELLGGWELQFTRGNEYSAVLTGDQGLVDTAEVSTAGDRLSIHLKGNIEEDRTVRIIINAPSIEALAVSRGRERPDRRARYA